MADDEFEKSKHVPKTEERCCAVFLKIIVTFVLPKTDCMICFIICSKKNRRACCNRIRDVVREQKNSYRDRGIFSASFSEKRCIARQLCNSQHKVAPPAGREEKKGQQSDLTLG